VLGHPAASRGDASVAPERQGKTVNARTALPMRCRALPDLAQTNPTQFVFRVGDAGNRCPEVREAKTETRLGGYNKNALGKDNKGRSATVGRDSGLRDY